MLEARDQKEREVRRSTRNLYLLIALVLVVFLVLAACSQVQQSNPRRDPPAELTAQALTWKFSVVDNNGSVGARSSLKIDSSGRLHVAYQDDGNSDLKYAVLDGNTWSVTTVDSVGDVGFWPSLALDASGHPHISYTDTTNWDLKYAKFDGSSWILSTVDALGNTGANPSLELDNNGHPHIAYRSIAGDLRYAVHNGNGWTLTTVGVGGNQLELELDSADLPHIVHMRATSTTTHELLYSKYNSTTSMWVTEVITDLNGSPKFVLDKNDTPHVMFRNISDTRLNYGQHNGTAWVYSDLQTVGHSPSFAIDSTGLLHVTFWTGAGADLRYGTYNGTAWSIATIDSEGDVGRESSLVIDSSDHLHVTYHDNTNKYLKYATTAPVNNVAPSVTLTPASTAVDEGGSVTFTIEASDPDADTLSLDSVSCGLSGTVSTQSFDSITETGSLTCTFSDGPATETVSVTIKDDHTSTSASASVTVNNVAPSITALAIAPELVSLGSPDYGATTLSLSFSDPAATHDTYTASIDWSGDGSVDEAVTVSEDSSNTITHTYSAAGVYTVSVTVDDGDGGSDTQTHSQYVVAYDPDGGFVTGGGWINSPDTACPVLCDGASGRANFGFNSRYQRGATVPTGQTQFQFRAGSLNFNSTSYEWLVIAGARAQYKGEGTINGSGDYGFMLTAIDGQVNGGGDTDRFRIKIWDRKDNDAIVYDNQMGATDDAELSTVIGGGSIVIHSGGNGGGKN